MSVHEILSMSELETTLEAHKKVVIVVTAVWCGPCRMSMPKYENLATRFEDIYFTAVDTDGAQEVASFLTTKGIPHYVLFKDGERYLDSPGPNFEKLEEALSSLSSES
ncbi:hypothetical protein K3495_g11336 [Podosphaera aphanis]|nr:hypothetical protein K3495_g11336 [Podosphaera aphanis]